MYQSQSYNGSDLPAKTLCITFDDGPGEYTADIARFLFENNIQATFFVVGKYAYHHPQILQQLKEMKHLIGNHTYDHPDLPYYVSANGNIIDQVLRTDTIIKPYIDSDKVYFRAPYGKWSAEVADELNKHVLTANHIGPIHWEIAGIDCYYWQNEWPVAEAAVRYITDIELVGKGIVVFHDEIADMDIVKPRNKTLDLLKVLIPQLLEMGYQFVRMDEITSIKTASQENPILTLKNKGKYISLKTNLELWVDGEPKDEQNLLQLEHLGHGKVALRAANNLYISTSKTSDEVSAKSNQITATETFDLILVDSHGLMFRCTNGHFLSIEKTGKLTASAQYMRQAAIFWYANHNNVVKNTLSIKQKLLLYKKQLLFIKSKLQQKFNNLV